MCFLLVKYYIQMSNYVVAIPTYNRTSEVSTKTLKTLKDGGVPKNRIYLFVANKQQHDLYLREVPNDLYGEIVIGKKGIANQRRVISTHFPEGQYVVSMDDDVEEFNILRGEKLAKMRNVDKFFNDAHKVLVKEGLYIWGIYPVRHPLFMYKNTTTDLRFLIGVTFGFITRHDPKLKISVKAETKEDYEQTILYFLKDGGVVRFNSITTKTKFNAPGGLGTDRYARNLAAAKYLTAKYPDIVSRNDRKDGTPEVRLAKIPRSLDRDNR